jgi:MFS superfamily sulfate permease-like transporter
VPQPPADLDQGLALLQAGATAAGVSYLLSMSIVRTFALKHHYATDASRELLALGLANLVGGFCGAYPSSGSLSRSALCSSVGGRTPMHGVIQAAVVAVVLLGCTPLFAPMPLSVLAAIIYAALLSLIDAELPLRLLRTSPSDFAMWAAAFFGTVLFGVQPGIALAIGSSLSLLVARASRPQCEVLGRLPGTDLFRNASVYPCCQHSFQHVLVFRFGAPLHFANCEFFCARLRKLWRRRLARGEPLSHVLIDCSAIGDIDHSANSALNGLADELRAAHVALLLGCASQTLRDRLAVFGTLGGADALICESNVFVSLSAAVDLGCNSEAAGGGRAAAAAASQPLPRAQSRAAALDKASRAAEFALELAERGHGSSACDGLGAADELDTARQRTPSAKPSPQQPTLFQHFTPSVERQRSLGARGFALLRPRSAARLADADDNSFTRPAYGRLASTRVSANLSAGDDSDNNGFDSADERDACPTQEGDLQTLPPGAPGYRFDSARRS